MDPIRYLMLFSGVEKIADDTQVSFSALFGLWVHCLNVPQLQDARRYAQKFNELSAKQTDSGILLQAHYVIGSFDLLVGNFSLVHARFKMKLSDNVCLETFSVPWHSLAKQLRLQSGYNIPFQWFWLMSLQRSSMSD